MSLNWSPSDLEISFCGVQNQDSAGIASTNKEQLIAFGWDPAWKSNENLRYQYLRVTANEGTALRKEFQTKY